MERRYTTITLDYLSDAGSYTAAIANGMACTALYPFAVVDNETGEVETLFYSHRLHKLEPNSMSGELFDDLRTIAKSVLKESGKTPKWVERFSDRPVLIKKILQGCIDDFNDM